MVLSSKRHFKKHRGEIRAEHASGIAQLPFGTGLLYLVERILIGIPYGKGLPWIPIHSHSHHNNSTQGT